MPGYNYPYNANPYMQMPYQQPYQQPINGLTQVVGIDGAKAYQIPPNSRVPLFDSNEDIFYVKSSDNEGKSTIRIFKFEEVKNDDPATNFATKDDISTLTNGLNTLNGKFDMIWEALNGKQSVSTAQQSNGSTE